MTRKRELVWQQVIPEDQFTSIPMLIFGDGRLSAPAIGGGMDFGKKAFIEVSRRRRDKFATLKVWRYAKPSKSV